MFALVDVNSFYASCEVIFRPDLRGHPVVVLSNNDGCVIAFSAEAKRLGISIGVPFFKIKEWIKRHSVHVFSSNYALYADMSARVMTILEDMAPSLEVYSIDEAFMHLPGVQNCTDLDIFGRQVRNRIKREAHLTVGVGIAQTKTLAKLANYAAKKWPGTGGVLKLTDLQRQRKLMSLVPVENVWGVGRRLSKKLNMMGINTALDLANSPTLLIRKHFSVVLERTVRELRGEQCLMPDEVVLAKQHIVCSRSFGYRVTQYSDMREAICTYAERAAEKLRRERQYCRHVGIFLRTSPHQTEGSFYSNHASGKLLIPSADTRDIIRLATNALDKIWQEGYRYSKAGVMLGDFFSQGVAQMQLFDENPPKKNSEALMRVIDHLNQPGNTQVWFAGQGYQKSWAMKQEMLSPAYTTRFSDLPIVKSI